MLDDLEGAHRVIMTRILRSMGLTRLGADSGSPPAEIGVESEVVATGKVAPKAPFAAADIEHPGARDDVTCRAYELAAQDSWSRQTVMRANPSVESVDRSPRRRRGADRNRGGRSAIPRCRTARCRKPGRKHRRGGCSAKDRRAFPWR